ncbi:winged helix-turn-helix transcriptional regulator [Lysobacter sp. HDW10]|uniref:MarR family winged helix-turn-helix transcriptional regulator n=1 Tax=Lysobacter sp. HDW10 TaxID=2714936 RepID=UPI0014082E66|nr:MarR family winged helix-turn-helix transcriptional regulator [Lysobacter sp. HDW10]QIK80452.1 winged helix-turn-helix transcriptional regulator [Lysobacter sp. HDW10]
MAVKAQKMNADVSLVLEDFIPYRLSVLSNRISARIAELYQAEFDLSVTEWRIIAVLGHFHALSANEVAARTAMDKVTVSRTVARLLERKLLKRRIDPVDRRKSVLDLSASGARMHARVAPLALQLEARLLSGFNAREHETLEALFDKLEVGLESLP